MNYIAVYRVRNMTLRLFDSLKGRGIRCSIINTPRELSLGCGISVAFEGKEFDAIKLSVNTLPKDNFMGYYRYDRGYYTKIN